MRRSALTALLSALLLSHFAFAADRPDPATQTGHEPAAAALLSGPGMAGSTTTLYLEVRVNGAAMPGIVQILVGADQRDYAWSDNLRELGIGELPTAQYVDLGTIAGLHYHIDMPAQRLDLDADAAHLRRPLQQFSGEADRYHAASTINGALLNYAVAGSGDDRQRDLSAFSDLRGFGDWGTLDSTALSSWHEHGDANTYRRLDTTYRYSAQGALWTVNAGDFISGALSWSRPTRLGGLQWRRDFSLQPGLITFPLPSFFGQAALPSTLELYVNGIREFQGQAQPGAYRVDTVPHFNGAGAAQLVITDALGRRDVVNFNFYAAQQLLQPGLFDYSVEVGVVRKDYGLSSFSYDDHLAASASLRYGLSDALTMEAHGEASDDLVLAGDGGIARLGRYGVLSAAAALSRTDQTQGRQYSLGHSWSNGRITTDLNSVRASSGYRDLASRDSQPPPRASDRALLGIGFGVFGSGSLSYTRLLAGDDSRFRYASLQYSFSPLPPLSLYTGYSHDLDHSSNDLLFAGLSWSFGGKLSAGLDLQDHDGQLRSGASLVRPLSPDGGYGWNLSAQHDADSDAAQGEIAWRPAWGQLNAGVRQQDDSTQLYGSAEGSVIFVDRDLFVSRRIDQSFALISTDGIADVPVSLENRPIGRTDARGHYLLTDLNAWQPNRVTIDTLALPAQIQADRVRIDAVPAAQRAVLVDFKLRSVRAALIVLRDATGKPLPLGSRVRYGHGTDAMVGYDGQVYLEGLAVHNPLGVTTPEGDSCHASFTLESRSAGLLTLELTCH